MEQPIKKNKFSYFARFWLRPQEIWERDYRASTPKFVACNIVAVESRPTSATLRATNFFVYPPSAAFRAIV